MILLDLIVIFQILNNYFVLLKIIKSYNKPFLNNLVHLILNHMVPLNFFKTTFGIDCFSCCWQKKIIKLTYDDVLRIFQETKWFLYVLQIFLYLIFNGTKLYAWKRLNLIPQMSDRCMFFKRKQIPVIFFGIYLIFIGVKCVPKIHSFFHGSYKKNLMKVT